MNSINPITKKSLGEFTVIPAIAYPESAPTRK